MNNVNWADGWDGGAYRVQKLFMKTYNENPDRMAYDFDDPGVDLQRLDFDKLRELFPDAVIVKSDLRSEEKTSCVEEEGIEDEEIEYSPDDRFYDDAGRVYLMGDWQSSTVVIYDDHLICSIERGAMVIWYKNRDIDKVLADLLNILPRCDPAPKEAEIKLVAFNQDYYTINSKIQPMTINLEENYNDDFPPVYQDIKTFLKDRKSGLVILRGEMGTGKTSIIRHLMTNCPGNYVLITTSLASHLASPEFMSFMLEHRNSIFILEDCEQVLMDRNDDNISGAIANILNMSDGLMSDIFNIKFICTFNADIDKIDKAILRKGRCFANYEFKKLSAEKSKNLLNKKGVELDEYNPMTLAEIYNYEDVDCSNKTAKKIGF
jgi:hypothetical protein